MKYISIFNWRLMPISCVWQLLSQTTALFEYESAHANLIRETLVGDRVSILDISKLSGLHTGVNYRRIRFRESFNGRKSKAVVVTSRADGNEGLQNSLRLWCCGNSGMALITLIGGPGAGNIIGFDLMPPPSKRHFRYNPPVHWLLLDVCTIGNI